MFRNDVFSMFSILASSGGYVTGKCLENMPGLLGVYLCLLVSLLLYLFKNKVLDCAVKPKSFSRMVALQLTRLNNILQDVTNWTKV